MTTTAPASIAQAQISPKWIVVVAVGWLCTTLLCFGLDTYALGPMRQNNDQRATAAELQAKMATALGETRTLLGAAPVTKPPEMTTPVAVLEIPELPLGQVVVEGVSPSETRPGPGTCPVLPAWASRVIPRSWRATPVTAHRSSSWRKSVYTVTETMVRALNEDGDYGRSDDRLTLVSSASWWPGSAEQPRS